MNKLILWWYDMIMIWYDIWYDMIYDICDVMWYYDIWYVWYDMIYDMIYCIWYMIWYDDIWYHMIWYDIIYYIISYHIRVLSLAQTPGTTRKDVSSVYWKTWLNIWSCCETTSHLRSFNSWNTAKVCLNSWYLLKMSWVDEMLASLRILM